MGERLVMTSRAEEAIGPGFLYDVGEDRKEVRLLDLYGKPIPTASGPRKHPWRMGITAAEALQRHPHAYYRQQIAPTDVWSLPREPMLGPGEPWYRDPELLAAHTEQVRLSLEAFLNAHLARMNRSARSGWWMLGRVRVQVVECECAPELPPRDEPPG